MPACCQHTNKEQSWKHTAIHVWIMHWICIRSSRHWVSAIVNHFICKPHSSGRKQLPLKWYPSVSAWKISSSSSFPPLLKYFVTCWKMTLCYVFCESQAINKLHVSSKSLNRIPHLRWLQPTLSNNCIHQICSRERVQHRCSIKYWLVSWIRVQHTWVHAHTGFSFFL